MVRLLVAISMITRMSPGAARVKELATIEGVRDNQLIGYGLGVGVAGTGGKGQTGVAVSPSAIQVSNTASVIVTATLPPFGQPGTRLDVTAAAIGDAKNLQGG